MTTNFGPCLRMSRPALMRLVCFVNSRASLSLSTRQSILRNNSTSASRCVSIHRSIVSATTNFGLATCASTCIWSCGEMLARNTYGVPL